MFFVAFDDVRRSPVWLGVLHPAPFAMANLRLRLTHLPEPYRIRDLSDRGYLHQRNVPIL